MSRLGDHRVNAAHSTANKARARLDQLSRQIEDAQAKHDDVLATRLQRERDYLLLNSLS